MRSSTWRSQRFPSLLQSTATLHAGIAHPHQPRHREDVGPVLVSPTRQIVDRCQSGQLKLNAVQKVWLEGMAQRKGLCGLRIDKYWGFRSIQSPIKVFTWEQSEHALRVLLGSLVTMLAPICLIQFQRLRCKERPRNNFSDEIWAHNSRRVFCDRVPQMKASGVNVAEDLKKIRTSPGFKRVRLSLTRL